MNDWLTDWLTRSPSYRPTAIRTPRGFTTLSLADRRHSLTHSLTVDVASRHIIYTHTHTHTHVEKPQTIVTKCWRTDWFIIKLAASFMSICSYTLFRSQLVSVKRLTDEWVSERVIAFSSNFRPIASVPVCVSFFSQIRWLYRATLSTSGVLVYRLFKLL
mgnify:CR=1 FL=1